MLNATAAPVCQFCPFLGEIQQYIVDSEQLKQIPNSAKKPSDMRAAKTEQGLG